MFYVYILSSLTGTLYVGLTDSLKRRVREHKFWLFDEITKRYKVNRLVYVEIFRDAKAAELRERQIKGFRTREESAIVR